MHVHSIHHIQLMQLLQPTVPHYSNNAPWEAQAHCIDTDGWATAMACDLWKILL